MSYLFIIITTLLLLFHLYMFVRIYMIKEHRIKISNLIFYSSVYDVFESIENSEEVHLKRLEHYNSVSYLDMFFRFWKPLDSFYDLNKFSLREYDSNKIKQILGEHYREKKELKYFFKTLKYRLGKE